MAGISRGLFGGVRAAGASRVACPRLYGPLVRTKSAVPHMAPGASARTSGLGVAPGVAPQYSSESEWEACFLEATKEIPSDATHAESAAAMRRLVQTGLLKHTDLRDRPSRFFRRRKEAHASPSCLAFFPLSTHTRTCHTRPFVAMHRRFVSLPLSFSLARTASSHAMRSRHERSRIAAQR